MSMKRVLVTGITGYIGSNLARNLLSDWEVYGLVREPLRSEYISDLQQQIKLLSYDGTYESVVTAMESCRPALVYHLAANCANGHGAETTPALVSANIMFGAYLLEAMTACGSPAVVNTSSVFAHYKGEIYCPLNLYAATKQAFSDLLAYYTDAGLLRAATLVLSDTYGPGDHRPKVLNLVREAARVGKPLALSDGGQDYDAVYIDDVVRALVLTGEQLLLREDWRNETFQVYTSEIFTLRQTVEKMLQVNNLVLDAAWGQRPSAEREIRKAVRLYPTPPGWYPQISLEEGVKKLL